MTKNLDFIIIGAQKAGTTTLFKYLQDHPQVFMPKEKEAPFFTVKERFEGGLGAYMDEFFKGAPDEALLGKATPHYLCDPGAAARIHQLLPAVKMIAVLRNPIDRAFSHYRMAIRRGLEQRSFAEAVAQLTRFENAEKARSLPAGRESEVWCYLAWGEYGRLLGSYLKHFPRGQLLVLMMEDLGADPGGSLRRILSFLGVDEGFVPGVLGQKFHVGGAREKFPMARRLVRWPVFRELWGSVPGRVKRPFRYWFHQFNIVKETDSEGISEADRRLLADYFRADVEALQEITGPVNWPEFKTKGGA